MGTIALDVDSNAHAEQRLLVQYRVTRILAEAATLDEAMPKILQAMCECLGWDRGSLWRIDREAGVLRYAGMWHTPSFVAPEYDAATRMMTFPPGCGLLGRVWASRVPMYTPDFAADPEAPHRDIAERQGLHAAFAVPIPLDSEVLGVMGFVSRGIWRPGTAAAGAAQSDHQRNRGDERSRKPAAPIDDSVRRGRPGYRIG
jgi:transcriptional regulator with GAF, ATPase, and Fis domain